MKLFFLSLSLFVVIQTNMNAQTLLFSKGDKAPSFEAITNEGKRFNLTQEVSKGPVVLVFYRGYWCPFCNKELKALNDSLSWITGKGASVIAISPETHESAAITKEKTKVTFPIISDTSNTILKKFGVDFKVDDNTVNRYKGFGVDFAKVNGNTENTLPVPAVFIIDKEGKFRYLYFEKDYRKRPSVQALADAL